MKLLENMNLNETKELLMSLKTYADMTKKLGMRWRKLFSKTLTGQSEYRVEYFPKLGESDAWDQAQKVFQKSFWKNLQKQDIIFIPLESLKWGMKVYMDDMMVDVSFKKVEQLLQK